LAQQSRVGRDGVGNQDVDLSQADLALDACRTLRPSESPMHPGDSAA